jgi:hypothetical protein
MREALHISSCFDTRRELSLLKAEVSQLKDKVVASTGTEDILTLNEVCCLDL